MNPARWAVSVNRAEKSCSLYSMVTFSYERYSEK